MGGQFYIKFSVLEYKKELFFGEKPVLLMKVTFLYQ